MHRRAHNPSSVIMNDSQQLKLIPGLLLAFAGVLVDATFRLGVYKDRIWAQIALWLAVSLQDGLIEDETSITFVLIHGTFFCSLVSAGYQAFLVQCRWTALNDSIQADYSRYLAPSMLLPLIYSWIYLTHLDRTNQSPWFRCVVMYFLALISLCGWRWTNLRKRRVRQDLVGMPTVESMPVFATSTRSLEERVWMDWTPTEVLAWIHSLEGDEWSCMCSQLAPEHIPGSALDTLTVRELRSMGLGYGPAQQLVDKIADLIERNPPTTRSRSDRYRHVEQDEMAIDEWLKDSRAPPSPRQHQEPGHEEATTSSTSLSASQDALPGELNEEGMQKAKDLFREQFGLELPEFKVRPPAMSEPTVSNAAGRYNEDMPATARTVSEPVTINTASSGYQAGSDFPKGFLESMPPHVREVAEQRPDLVNMLWKQKLQGKSATSLGLSEIAREAAELNDIATASHNIEEEDTLEEDDLCDANSDSERTGLLRKRATRPPPKYAAIR